MQNWKNKVNPHRRVKKKSILQQFLPFTSGKIAMQNGEQLTLQRPESRIDAEVFGIPRVHRIPRSRNHRMSQRGIDERSFKTGKTFGSPIEEKERSGSYFSKRSRNPSYPLRIRGFFLRFHPGRNPDRSGPGDYHQRSGLFERLLHRRRGGQRLGARSAVLLFESLLRTELLPDALRK